MHLEKYNITITPPPNFLGHYTDQKDIFPYRVTNHVAETGILPKTAAVSVGTYTDVFTELKKDCDEIIHFTISSEMSSCYQNAKLAAEEIGGIQRRRGPRTLSLLGIGHLAISGHNGAARDQMHKHSPPCSSHQRQVFRYFIFVIAAHKAVVLRNAMPNSPLFRFKSCAKPGGDMAMSESSYLTLLTFPMLQSIE